MERVLVLTRFLWLLKLWYRGFFDVGPCDILTVSTEYTSSYSPLTKRSDTFSIPANTPT
jgi:hypothetical protein